MTETQKGAVLSSQHSGRQLPPQQGCSGQHFFLQGGALRGRRQIFRAGCGLGVGRGAWQCTGQNLLSQGKKNVNQIENEQHSMFLLLLLFLSLYKNEF